MNTTRLTTFLTVLCALSLTGCGKNKQSEDHKRVTDQKIEFSSLHSDIKYSKEYFAINPFNINLAVNEESKVNIASIPSSYAEKDLNYVSKDPSIASVDSSGNIKGVAKGKTTVEVSSTDGQAKETINVYVTEEISKADGAVLLQAQGAKISEASYQKTSKLWLHEYVNQSLAVNGSIINDAAYVEEIIFSQPDAYFEVYSDDIEVKTADGSVEVSSGRWVFFVDQDSYDTYLIHDTPTEKNYMEVHTQKYLGKPAYTILYDILDMFFLSGKDIVVDSFEDADGYDLFDNDASILTSCALNDYSNATEELFTPDNKDVFAHCCITQTNDVVNAKTEFSIDIPAGTVYDEEDHYYVYVEDGHTKSFDITATMDFELYGKPSRRTFIKNQQFITDFEVSTPNLAEYTLVDSIYDL